MEALENSVSCMQIDPRGLCCNHQPGLSCTKIGSLACKNCLMVAGKYCSKRCQTAHWPTHRDICQSPLFRGTWKPRWVVENRSPTFIGSTDADQVKFGAEKYLWGNVPAFDVIQLGQNEGVDFRDPMNLLFAASGDLRNVVLSVASLPRTYQSPLNIVINDREIDIVARNLVFLLIMFVEEDPHTAAEYMLHVWYSALVTEACYNVLQKKLKPLIEDVCDKIVGRPNRSLLGKTWTFGGSSLRLVLTREAWVKLPSYFDVPNGMTKETAQAVRQAVVNVPSRVDYVDRAVLMRPPHLGLGMIDFRNHGVLVPFGQSRDAFIVPNPTVFDTSKEWPMMDSADPKDGWSMKTFMATKAGPAKQDANGQLHHYLKRLFMNFHQSLRSKPVSFQLHHVDAKILNKTLTGKKFDRIEVSNISDGHYLGIGKTLEIFGPLLRSPSANPHATLITGFLNAVPEAKMMSQLTNLTSKADLDIAMEYMKSDLPRPTRVPADMAERLQTFSIKIASAVNSVADMDFYFNLYMELEEFANAAASAGVQMKERHTIIQPWPLRVNGGLHPTTKDKEDFKLLLGTAHVGHERYVEWKVDPMRTAARTQAEAHAEGLCVLS